MSLIAHYSSKGNLLASVWGTQYLFGNFASLKSMLNTNEHMQLFGAAIIDGLNVIQLYLNPPSGHDVCIKYAQCPGKTLPDNRPQAKHPQIQNYGPQSAAGLNYLNNMQVLGDLGCAM